MTHLYELLYIIPATVTDTEVGTVETKIAALLTKLGATIEFTKRLGKLKLTYVVEKQRYGHYVAVIFSADASVIAKIEENLRINTEIIRHLLLRTEKTIEAQKFDLIQFIEINVEEERARRRERAEEAATEKEKPAEAKEGAAAVEGEAKAEEAAPAPAAEETKTV